MLAKRNEQGVDNQGYEYEQLYDPPHDAQQLMTFLGSGGWSAHR